jgi:hypothetical protein
LVDASLVIEALVAVGTIGLSLLTVYQTQLLIRERRASQARELAEKIYTPLRVEVVYWQDVELVRLPPWKFFKDTMPYLTLRVPKDIATLLDGGDQILRNMARLEEKARNFCGDQLKSLGWELAQAKGQRSTLEPTTAFRVLVNNSVVLTLDGTSISQVWVSGKDLKRWVSDYCSKNLPDAAWKMDVIVGGQNFGDLENAETIATKLFGSLAGQPYAEELRASARALVPIGVKALQRIDKELAKEARL